MRASLSVKSPNEQFTPADRSGTFRASRTSCNVDSGLGCVYMHEEEAITLKFKMN